MTYDEFASELCIVGKALSVTRLSNVQAYCPEGEGCAFQLALHHALDGETVRLSAETVRCFGGKGGFGFVDGLMDVPGGYGHFVSFGAGEGAPPGMRLKQSPALAEAGALALPQDVMGGHTVIEIKPYADNETPDLVTILASPDQLSALNLLFHFRKVESDHTCFPTGSGCSSVFRIPFAELRSENPRAVIGNADISTRPAFGADTFFFTVPGATFKQMLVDAGESFLIAPAWKKLKGRMEG